MTTLGFDLDGVLYDWRRAVWTTLQLEFHEDRTFYQFWIEEEEADSGNGISRYNKMFWRNLTRREDLYDNIPPDKGVVETLHALAKKYDVVYITHRSPWVRYATEKFMRQYDFPVIENLIMSPKPKHLLVRQYDCEYYVEDRGKILASQLKNVCTLFGMRTISNEYLWDDPQITFIDAIPELLDYLGG